MLFSANTSETFSFAVIVDNSYPFCNIIFTSVIFLLTAKTPIPDINTKIMLTHIIFTIESEAFSLFFIIYHPS